MTMIKVAIRFSDIKEVFYEDLLKTYRFAALKSDNERNCL